MCDSSLDKKKNLGDCPDCSYHLPERKHPNVCKFRRKKMANFEEFLTPRRAGGPGSTLRVKYFAKAFFYY
jgi:hypothetical protein